MTVRAKEMTGKNIRSADGEIGKVKDILFDSVGWKVRYIHVDTWDWLPDHKLVLPPALFGGPPPQSGLLAVAVSKSDIADGALVGAEGKITRPVEERIHHVFGLKPYWGARVPGGADLAREEPDAGKTNESAGPVPESTLRSFRETTGYEVVATDGPAGRLADLILDESWQVGRLSVDTTDWIRDGVAELDPRYVTGVDTAGRKIKIGLTREQIENDPGFKPVSP